jgi:hypothetical protein
VSNSGTRPLSISLTAFFVVIAAVANFLLGIILVLAIKPLEFDLESGSGFSKPSQVELVAGISCIIMGFVYIWVIRELLTRSQVAYTLISTVATINILFSLFRFPLGLLTLALNLTAIFLIRSKSAKSWSLGE